jgi:DNA-binding NarL/FixJ family response regulator
VIRVVLVDDQHLMRAGLAALLDRAEDITVTGEAEDGAAGVALARAEKPDIVLMDIRMPGVDGIEATRHIVADDRLRDTKVIVLTTFDTDEYVLGALRAGASGFLLKDTPPAQIVEAVRKVAAGDPILSPAITRRLMDRAATEAGTQERAQAALATLSPRESDVVIAVARGRSNAEIAHELHLSVATVKAHLTHIFTKLDLGNRTQIALLAHDAGLT